MRPIEQPHSKARGPGTGAKEDLFAFQLLLAILLRTSTTRIRGREDETKSSNKCETAGARSKLEAAVEEVKDIDPNNCPGGGNFG